MTWLYVLALAVIALIILVLIDRWGGAEAPAEESAAAGSDSQALVQVPLTSRALETVEFDSAFRGYRMDQVDQLLDALTEQLRAAEQRGEGTEQNSNPEQQDGNAEQNNSVAETDELTEELQDASGEQEVQEEPGVPGRSQVPQQP